MPYRRAHAVLISAIMLAASINFTSAQQISPAEPSGADIMRLMRKNQAEQQRALEAAIADVAKPTTMMLNAYRNYLAARQCFDSRTGFALAYLTLQQMEQANAQVKGIIEAALL